MISSQENKFISVSTLNNYIKTLFDNTITLQNIALHGEISNYSGANRSGHIYFSLKDEECSIRAVMFKYDALSLTFEPKNGDDVICYGSVSSYPPSGSYQIIIKKIELFGQGALLLKKQQLKEKLFKEGYFNEDHKKELPKFPMNVGLITGKNSAASIDVIKNINRRFPLTNISVYYSLVQGVEAPKDLIKTLHKAEKDELDLIIFARGGGSLEDLNAFDDEELVKEIYKCPIPTISAIGHEINRSLCDLVADKYVSTPTGAAELAVPDREELLESLSQIKGYLDTLVLNKIQSIDTNLVRLKNSKCLLDLSYNYDRIEQNLINYQEKSNNLLTQYLQNLRSNVDSKVKLIEAFNPNNVLKKGYSIVYDQNNKIVKSNKAVNSGENLTIKVYDGTIHAKVEEK